MNGFVKVYTSILDSSIWTEELHVRVVWLALLALADARGMVEASVTGLTRRANVTREQCEDALKRFTSPDLDSKSPENEGRRIAAVKGGWLILNYKTYRERGTSTERVKRMRARDKGESVTDETPGNGPLLLSSSLELPEEEKAKRDVTRETRADTVLEIGELVQRIRGLAVNGPSGPVIPHPEVEKLGADVLRAYKAIGGSARFMAATGKDYSWLVREFTDALKSARSKE